MNKTKKIVNIAILAALYVALSLTLKIPLGMGNIQMDMGYIALTVACVIYGPCGAIVGALGAAIESMCFAAYGISWGWIAMNVVIGIACGVVLPKIKDRFWISALTIVTAVFIGAMVKTAVECLLYGIPLLVKLPKSALAWVVDSVVMIIGLPIVKRLTERNLTDAN